MRYLIVLLLIGCSSQGSPLTAAGVSQDAANAISRSIAQEEVLDPSGLTAADTAQILKK